MAYGSPNECSHAEILESKLIWLIDCFLVASLAVRNSHNTRRKLFFRQITLLRANVHGGRNVNGFCYMENITFISKSLK